MQERSFDDGLRATLLVCLVYPLGPAAIILMPMIVGGLVDRLGLTEQEAANIASMEGLGLVVASVLAAAWIRRVSWVRALVASALAYAALNVASAALAGALPLAIARFATGFAGGSVFAITVAALGDNRAPDRAFGLAQAAQGAMMLAAFLAAPALLARWGVAGLYGLLAAAALLLLPVAWRFPASGRRRATTGGGGAGTHGALIGLGLAASVVYFVSVFGFWTFIERIGQAGGLDAGTIGAALGVSQLMAVAGALAAAAASDRYGRMLPLVLVLVGQCAALLALYGRFGAAAYFASAGAFQALFIVAVSYQMGAVAALDTRGRFLVMMTGAQGLGAAIGPAFAAALIGGQDEYRGVIQMAAACCLVSTLAFLFIVQRSRAAHTR